MHKSFKSGIFALVCRAALFGTLLAVMNVAAFASGGGGSTGPNPLPQTAPAPDIMMRESFGQGPDLMRPASGKGTLKSTATGGTSINGFWLEYLGTKDYRWIAPDSGVTWRFCGTMENPYELFSPLQMFSGYYQNTIICDLLNVPQTAPVSSPTALVPMLQNVNVPYEVEINGSYHGIPGAYFAFGFTNSATTSGNLAAAGGLVFVTRPSDAGNTSTNFELRLGGLNGQLLASGSGEDLFFNRMKIRFNPLTRAVSASYNGVELGNFATGLSNPRYLAIEGIGYADNFVVRKLQ